MQSKKYINNFLLFVLLLVFSQISIATVLEKKCGGGLYIIEIYNGFSILKIKYKVYYKAKDKVKKMILKTRGGSILSGACIKGKTQQDLILVNEISGGNGAPEDRFTVYDPRSEKMLIQATSWDKGNSKETEKIIGYSPFEIKDDAFFCCSNNN